MQSARSFVIIAFEFATRVENSKNDLQRALAGLGMFVDWNPTTVIRNGYCSTIFVQCYDDFIRVTIHRLIDGVVQNLPNQMMQTGGAHTTDIHRWSLANGLQSFQSNNVGRGIGLRCRAHD